MPAARFDAPLAEVRDRVVAEWEAGGEFADQTVLRMGEIASKFVTRMGLFGVGSLGAVTLEHCSGFVDAPPLTGGLPSAHTRHFRRVTLRAMFRTARRLGFDVGDPTLDLVLPPRSDRSTRPLTSDEILLARTATSTPRTPDSRRAAAWALAETAAMTSEIPRIRVEDLSYGARGGVQVSLPGTRRCDPRVVAAGDWASTVLRRRAGEVAAGRLVYGGGSGEVAAQASVCKTISSVLGAVGLDDADVRPESVRLWRATQEFVRCDLVAAARVLGSRSLDRTAQSVGFEWRPQ